MTQEEFDKLLAEIKEKSPNLFQLIEDFVDRKLTSEEVETFLSMAIDQQRAYINNYQAR